MNPSEIDRAIEALRTRLSREPNVRSAILYGSSARGTARADSDIDLLVVVSGGRTARLRDAIHDVESSSNVTVSPLIVEVGGLDRLDPQFLDSILRDGRVLVGALPTVTLQDLTLRPIRIVSFDVSHLPPAAKMRLYRQLDGYATVKRRGRKRYERRVVGFLKEVGGWRLGRGAVVVPEAAMPHLEDILVRVNAKRWTIPAWSQVP